MRWNAYNWMINDISTIFWKCRSWCIIWKCRNFFWVGWVFDHQFLNKCRSALFPCITFWLMPHVTLIDQGCFFARCWPFPFVSSSTSWSSSYPPFWKFTISASPPPPQMSGAFSVILKGHFVEARPVFYECSKLQAEIEKRVFSPRYVLVTHLFANLWKASFQLSKPPGGGAVGRWV